MAFTGLADMWTLAQMMPPVAHTRAIVVDVIPINVSAREKRSHIRRQTG